jgi:hypothetical protein
MTFMTACTKSPLAHGLDCHCRPVSARPARRAPRSSLGSGVVITKEAVLINCHVVAGARTLSVAGQDF